MTAVETVSLVSTDVLVKQFRALKRPQIAEKGRTRVEKSIKEINKFPKQEPICSSLHYFLEYIFSQVESCLKLPFIILTSRVGRGCKGPIAIALR